MGISITSSDVCDVHEAATTPLRIAPVFDVNRKVKQTLMRLRDEIDHENVARFFGNKVAYFIQSFGSRYTR